MKRLTVSLTSLVVLAGCATVPKDGGFPDVNQRVSDRSGQAIHWKQGTPEDEAVASEIDALLGQPLTLPAAIKLALLNNPDLQVLYENLGIAQADVVQAGLLENPVFAASVRFPDHDRESNTTRTITRESGGGFSFSRETESSRLHNNLEFALVQNFLDILMLPMRKQMAEAHFEHTKLVVSHEVLTFIAKVKRAYYEYVAALQIAELHRTVTMATGAASVFAIEQYDAGNLSRLEMHRENAFHADALLAAAQADTETRLARERLNRMLGLWTNTHAWRLASERLPEASGIGLRPDELESTAIANRYDLAAAVNELETLVFGLKATKTWRWLGLLDLSVSTERETDGIYVTGPALELQLPIFDQGQTKIAAAESNLRAGSQRVSALAIDIRSETGQAYERFMSSWDTVDYYRSVLLPAHQAILDESQLHYNAMLVGVYDLLMDKQRQIETARRYVESLREYWLALTDLEMALGGAPLDIPGPPLPETELPEPSDPEPQPSAEHSEHDHH